jgi:cytochrome b561
MPLKNTERQFGFITKLCHWLIFILFIVQYFLVYRREYFPKDAPEKLQYILLHKSFGVIVLALALLMLVWRHVGRRPAYDNSMPHAQKCAARIMHLLLYISMLVMPISGITMSQLGGRTVKVFDWFALPNILDKNKEFSELVYYVHLYSSYIIIGIVSLHIIAALYHHFIQKDNILSRMLPFKKI